MVKLLDNNNYATYFILFSIVPLLPQGVETVSDFFFFILTKTVYREATIN